MGHYSKCRESPETALEDLATVTEESSLSVTNYVNVETPILMGNAENKNVTAGLSKSITKVGRGFIYFGAFYVRKVPRL